MSGGAREPLEVDGRQLLVSNLDKVLYPSTGFTKGDLLRYYRAVAPWILPHLARRGVTLARWPDGVAAEGWFQANCHGHPSWLPTVSIAGKRGQTLRYCLIEDVAALLWVANRAAIELHPFVATVDAPDRPTWAVFDLDPGAGVGPVGCGRVALRVREALVARGVDGWVKTSGGNGLHVYVALDGAASFDDSKRFARAIAGELARRWPDEITDRMPLAERAGRVFIDWVQNNRSRSTVAPYSLRATPRPAVSMPIEWDELARAVDGADDAALRVGPVEALEQLERDGDRFRAVLARGYAVP